MAINVFACDLRFHCFSPAIKCISHGFEKCKELKLPALEGQRHRQELKPSRLSGSTNWAVELVKQRSQGAETSSLLVRRKGKTGAKGGGSHGLRAVRRKERTRAVAALPGTEGAARLATLQAGHTSKPSSYVFSQGRKGSRLSAPGSCCLALV